jgi:hypothetical protein
MCRSIRRHTDPISWRKSSDRPRAILTAPGGYRASHDVYHAAELNETLGIAGLPLVDFWD